VLACVIVATPWIKRCHGIPPGRTVVTVFDGASIPMVDTTSWIVEITSAVVICDSTVIVVKLPVPPVRVSMRIVIPAVGQVVHYTIGVIWPHIEYVPGAPDVTGSPYINKTGIVTESSPGVVIYPHSANAYNTSVVIYNIGVPCTGYPSVLVVKDGDIFDLNYRTVIVVLQIRFVIVTSVVIDIDIARVNVHVYAATVVVT
jgi:hypothetical protein